MFEHYSYLGYTLLFCLPPIVLLWVRSEFAPCFISPWRSC